MGYIKRDLEEKIKKYLKRREMIAIVGARQAGKTTILKHILKDLKNAKFVSFDDQIALRTFTEDVDLFVKEYVENTDFLFIDEFQYAKEGGKKLKYIYDNYKIKIIISGSSVAELSVQSLKYLVGRIFIFTLFPLSFTEFLRYKNPDFYEILDSKKISQIMIERMHILYKEYVIFGGYPEVVLANNKEEKIEILRNIYNTYLLREIREILQIGDDSKLTKLIKALSLQAGNLVNYNELSVIVGLDYRELVKHIDILIKTFVIMKSVPFFTNKRKELVKTPRLFFVDSGFRNIIISNFQKLEDRTDLGSLNENFVASELLKKGFKLNYWRTKAGAEVDFIIEKDNKEIPIEVKSNLTSFRYGRSFKNFIIDYDCARGFILSNTLIGKISFNKVKIDFVPVFLISKML